MEKTATLNLRVNPKLKQDAESILNRLGIPMSTAIDLFLNQIVITRGIPFDVKLPNAPENVDATKMSARELHDKIMEGYEDYLAGNVTDAGQFFDHLIKDIKNKQ